jgi:vacuolar-type H+-ATPase subunit I/STV1
MNLRNIITTSMEIVGAICIVVGISSFSIPIGVIVAGILLVVGGGLAA